MIARSSKAMGAALICKNFSSIPSKISFHIKKKSVVTAQYLQSIKTFLILEVSQYRKSGSTLSSNEPDAARSDCRQLWNALCLCLPVLPAKAVPERCPKSLAIDFAVKSFDCLLE